VYCSLGNRHQNSSFFSFIHQRWVIYCQFLTQNHLSNSCFFFLFLFPFYWNKWFSHLFRFFFCDFVVLVRRYFVRHLCATLFVFLVSFRYLFGSDCQISFDPVQIKSMTLESSRLQIRRHEYSGDLNTVICVGFSTLSFYTINMDAVNLFTDSSFLLLANFHCINVLY